MPKENIRKPLFLIFWGGLGGGLRGVCVDGGSGGDPPTQKIYI